MKDFFLDLAYLFGFLLRAGQLLQAIAVCHRATQELSHLDREEGSEEPAREQMQMVLHRLEDRARGLFSAA